MTPAKMSRLCFSGMARPGQTGRDVWAHISTVIDVPWLGGPLPVAGMWALT